MVATVQLTGSALAGIGPPYARSAVATLPPVVRLGRIRPAALPMVPRFSSFWDEAQMATPPPPSINRRDKAAASLARMYLNDRYGCCVISGKAHGLGLFSANDSDSGGQVSASDQEIYQQYQSICGPGDNGCVITRVLDVMRSRGFVAGGKSYKIDGYVSCDHRSKLQTQVVQYLFGATSIGFNLPQSWTQDNVWDVTSSPIIGGHDVTPIDYDERGVYVSSWGRIYLMTWAAWQSTKWIEEYYAWLAPLWYGADGLAPSGVNAAALKAALAALSRGELPPLPGPAPVPPDPEPIPPAPTPTPGKTYVLTTLISGGLLFTPSPRDALEGEADVANNPNEQVKQQLQSAGVAEQHHEQAMAVKSAADARGMDWSKIISAFKKWGPVVFEILAELLADQPQGATAAAPKK